ncbi:HAD family hydrolase, partial [Candidatus Methanarcanum hacksteinii]
LVAGIDYLHSIGKDISSDELERMVNEESTRIETLNISSSKPFPMVRELLDEISSKGYKIGLLSRGHRGYVLKTMDRFDLTGYFDAIEAYDDHPVGEQKPNPVAMEYLAKGLGVRTDEMIYVGDAVTDYLCARDSGAAFIGLAQNEHSRTMWESYDHRPEILNNISELIGRF